MRTVSPDDAECYFTCKQDYVRIVDVDGNENCAAPPLKASTANARLAIEEECSKNASRHAARLLKGQKAPPPLAATKPDTVAHVEQLVGDKAHEDETPGTCLPSSKLRGRRVKSIPGIWACEELRRCQVLMRRRVA